MFRPYPCPCPGSTCAWFGNETELLNHIAKSHDSIAGLEGRDIVFLANDINLPGADDWIMIQSCFGQNFVLILQRDTSERSRQLCQSRFFTTVRLIGSRSKASQFAYKIQLKRSGDHYRSLSYEAVVNSVHDSLQSLTESSNCLILPAAVAQLFSQDGTLGLNVTISRVSGLPLVRLLRIKNCKPNLTVSSF